MAALQSRLASRQFNRPGETSAQSTILTPMNAPGRAQSLYQVQLNALPPIYWQIVMVGQKNTGSTLKTWPLQKTADLNI